MGRAFGGGDPTESLALARLACAVGEDARTPTSSPPCSSCSTSSTSTCAPPAAAARSRRAARLFVVALIVARTPDVPLPALPDPRRDARGGRGARAKGQPQAE